MVESNQIESSLPVPEADLLGLLAADITRGLGPKNGDASTRRTQQSGDCTQHGALPGSVFSEHDKEFARGKFRRHVAKRSKSPELFGEVSENHSGNSGGSV